MPGRLWSRAAPRRRSLFISRASSQVTPLWCQGFSEPNAGSDLASLKTRGRVEDDDIVVNGAKMWTTDAMHADYQELLIRTDPAPNGIKG